MKLTKRTRRAKGIWMYLPEENRLKLLKLMTIQGVSARELSRELNKKQVWRSRNSLQRILNAEFRTLTTDAATVIAHYLGVGVDDLFLARATGDSGSTHRQRRAS